MEDQCVSHLSPPLVPHDSLYLAMEDAHAAVLTLDALFGVYDGCSFPSRL